MTIAGSMTTAIYDSEIRKVEHFNGYIIINQSYWLPENKYTEEKAVEKYLRLKRQRNK